MEKTLNRLGIFAMYSEDGVVDDFIYYLLDKMLEEVLSDLIIVSNGPIQDSYYKELEKRATSIYLREDRGFDGGAYQDLFLNFCSDREWDCYDEIVLFNDSFYGPIHSMKHTFEMMEKKNYDFWGMLYCRFDDEEVYKYGLNTVFVVFSRNILESRSFLDYWKGMEEETYYGKPGCFERSITIYFESKGFSHGSVLNENGWKYKLDVKVPSWVDDVEVLIEKYKLPILKCRALSVFHYRDMKHIMDYLRIHTDYHVDLIEKHREHLAKNNKLGGYTEKKIEEFVNCHERIFVYGHGKYGKGLAVLFEDKKWTISGYIVSKDASDKEISINELELRPNDGVIVALGMVAIQDAMDNIKRIPADQLLMYDHRSL